MQHQTVVDYIVGHVKKDVPFDFKKFSGYVTLNSRGDAIKNLEHARKMHPQLSWHVVQRFITRSILDV